MTTHVEAGDPLCGLKQPVADVVGLHYLDHVGQAQQLRNHFVVPSPLDIENHAAVGLRADSLPGVKRLLAGPAGPRRVHANPIPAGGISRAEDRDAVGEEFLDRLSRPHKAA